VDGPERGEPGNCGGPNKREDCETGLGIPRVWKGVKKGRKERSPTGREVPAGVEQKTGPPFGVIGKGKERGEGENYSSNVRGGGEKEGGLAVLPF